MDEQKEMRERSKESKGKISQPVPVLPVSDIGYRRPQPGGLRSDDFFSGEYDPVDLAIAVTHGDRKDRLLWRTYLRNGSIDEADFLQCVFSQWREDLSDGEPANPAACLQLKLKPLLRGRPNPHSATQVNG